MNVNIPRANHKIIIDIILNLMAISIKSGNFNGNSVKSQLYTSWLPYCGFLCK